MRTEINLDTDNTAELNTQMESQSFELGSQPLMFPVEDASLFD